MIDASNASPAPAPIAGVGPAAPYQPGVCNIGPQEIARRRRAGHIGLAAAIGLFALLYAVEAPPISRALAGLPAAMAASGYLQARFRFCAGFASRGVFNFGAIGETSSIVDPADRAKDRAKARQIALLSLGVGIVAAVVAVAVPR